MKPGECVQNVLRRKRRRANRFGARVRVVPPAIWCGPRWLLFGCWPCWCASCTTWPLWFACLRSPVPSHASFWSSRSPRVSSGCPNISATMHHARTRKRCNRANKTGSLFSPFPFSPFFQCTDKRCSTGKRKRQRFCRIPVRIANTSVSPPSYAVGAFAISVIA